MNKCLLFSCRLNNNGGCELTDCRLRIEPVKKTKTVRITYVIEQEIDDNVNMEELQFKSYEDFYFFYSYKLKELQSIKIESLDHDGEVIDEIQNIYDF